MILQCLRPTMLSLPRELEREGICRPSCLEIGIATSEVSALRWPISDCSHTSEPAASSLLVCDQRSSEDIEDKANLEAPAWS